MSILARSGGVVNSLLKKIGFKIVTVERTTGKTYAEKQLLRALRDLSTVYTRLVFDAAEEPDPESLRLLSDSPYTSFSKGLFLIEYLRRSCAVNGDVCEFGVAQGVISSVLAHGIGKTGKNLWLFDSFQGLGKASDKDVLIGDILHRGSADRYEGELSFPEEMVRSRLAGIGFPEERTRIIPGFIEQTIHRPDLPGEVCFAYVDFDFYEPILTALVFLDRVIQPGGIIVVDDYGTFSEGAQTAADEFYESRKEKYNRTVPTKTGQTICIFTRKP